MASHQSPVEGSEHEQRHTQPNKQPTRRHPMSGTVPVSGSARVSGGVASGSSWSSSSLVGSLASASGGATSTGESDRPPAIGSATPAITTKAARRRKHKQNQMQAAASSAAAASASGESDLASPASSASTYSSASASPPPPYASSRPPALHTPGGGSVSSLSPASGGLSSLPGVASPLISPFSLITRGIRKNTHGQPSHRGKGAIADDASTERTRLKSDASRTSGGAAAAAAAGHPLPPYHAAPSAVALPPSQPESAWIAVTPAQPKPRKQQPKPVEGVWSQPQSNGHHQQHQQHQRQHLPDSSTTPPLANTSRQKESAKSRKRASQQQLQSQQPTPPHPPQPQPPVAQSNVRRPPNAIALPGSPKVREGWQAANPAYAHAANGTAKDHPHQPPQQQQHGAPRHSQKGAANAPNEQANSNRTHHATDAHHGLNGFHPRTSPLAGDLPLASPLSAGGSGSPVSMSPSVRPPRRLMEQDRNKLVNFLTKPPRGARANKEAPGSPATLAPMTPPTMNGSPCAKPTAPAPAAAAAAAAPFTLAGHSSPLVPPRMPVFVPSPASCSSPVGFPSSIANKDRPSVARYNAKANHAHSNPGSMVSSAHTSRMHTPSIAYSSRSSSRNSPRGDGAHSPFVAQFTRSAPASPAQSRAARRAAQEEKIERDKLVLRQAEALLREKLDETEDEVDPPNDDEEAPEPYQLKRASSSPNITRTDLHLGPRLHRSSSPLQSRLRPPQSHSLNSSFDRRRRATQDDTNHSRHHDAEDEEDESEAAGTDPEDEGLIGHSEPESDHDQDEEHRRALGHHDEEDEMASHVESESDLVSNASSPRKGTATGPAPSHAAAAAGAPSSLGSAGRSASSTPLSSQSAPPVFSRLHHEIVNISNGLGPTPVDERVRQLCQKRVSEMVWDLWTDAEVHVIGSCATNLFLPDSDIDLVVRNSSGKPKLNTADLHQLGEHLRPITTWLQIISTASVPLIKLRLAVQPEHSAAAHDDSRWAPMTDPALQETKYYDVDITLNVETGLYSTSLVIQQLDYYPDVLHRLTIVLKQFLKVKGKNDLYSGGLPSYSLILMIVFFLQNHPQEKQRQQRSRRSSVEEEKSTAAASASSSSSSASSSRSMISSATSLQSIVHFGSSPSPSKAAVPDFSHWDPHSDINGSVDVSHAAPPPNFPLLTQLQKGGSGELVKTPITSPRKSKPPAATSTSNDSSPSAIQRLIGNSSPIDPTNIDLGDYLLAFLRLYGFDFDYERHGISLRKGVFLKASRGWYHPHNPSLLCLENPMDESIDLGFKVFNYAAIRTEFQTAYQTLKAGKTLDGATPTNTATSRAHTPITAAAASMHPPQAFLPTAFSAPAAASAGTVARSYTPGAVHYSPLVPASHLSGPILPTMSLPAGVMPLGPHAAYLPAYGSTHSSSRASPSIDAELQSGQLHAFYPHGGPPLLPYPVALTPVNNLTAYHTGAYHQPIAVPMAHANQANHQPHQMHHHHHHHQPTQPHAPPPTKTTLYPVPSKKRSPPIKSRT